MCELKKSEWIEKNQLGKIDGMLKNWGDWMRQRGTGALGYGQSPLANLLGRSQRAEPGCIIPIDSIEASKIDDIVRSLPQDQQRLATAWYVDSLTIRACSIRLGMSTTTVPKRLNRLCVAVELNMLRQSATRIHAGCRSI